jgi:hypothetical protein
MAVTHVRFRLWKATHMKVNHLEPSISKLPPPRPVPVPKRGFLFSSAAICEQTAWKIPRDLLLSGEDIRQQPLNERKTALKWVLRKSREGIQYVEHAEGHGDKLFAAVCNLGLEGIVSKKLNAPYKSGPSKAWLKIKNPNAPAATRAIDGTF